VLFHKTYFLGAQQPYSGPGCLIVEVSRSYTIRHTVFCRDYSGRGIGPSQEPLPDNIWHSQETGTCVPVGNRTRNSSKRAVADSRLSTRGHLNRHS